MAQVFLLDRDASLREALRGALEDDGHTVVEAAEGRVAAQQLRLASTATVVLLDDTRGHRDGVALVHALAADTVLAGQHAYILTTTDRPPSLPPAQRSARIETSAREADRHATPRWGQGHTRADTAEDRGDTGGTGAGNDQAADDGQLGGWHDGRRATWDNADVDGVHPREGVRPGSCGRDRSGSG